METLLLNDFLSVAEISTIVDTRTTEIFKEGYIPDSIHLPSNTTKFLEWAAAVLDTKMPVILVAEPGTEANIEKLFVSAGYRIIGFLEGGFETWEKAGLSIDLVIEVEPDELMMDIPFDDNLVLIDVRKPLEYAEGHLKDAVNLPLHEFNDPEKLAIIEDNDNLYLYCSNGARSTIAISILKKEGIHNVRNVAGGWNKIKEEPRAQIVKEPEMLN